MSQGVQIEQGAFATAALHAVKFPHCSVCGVLIGSISRSNPAASAPGALSIGVRALLSGNPLDNVIHRSQPPPSYRFSSGWSWRVSGDHIARHPPAAREHRPGCTDRRWPPPGAASAGFTWIAASRLLRGHGPPAGGCVRGEGAQGNWAWHDRRVLCQRPSERHRARCVGD